MIRIVADNPSPSAGGHSVAGIQRGGEVAALAAARALPASPDAPVERNRGLPLDLAWLEEMRPVNRSALERRVATLTKRRSIKGENQAAWLLRSITVMDLTTLNSNDTHDRVRRLCAKALNPLRPDIVDGLGIAGRGIRPAAVCIYHPFVATAVSALRGSGVHVAAVSTALPGPISPLNQPTAPSGTPRPCLPGAFWPAAWWLEV